MKLQTKIDTISEFFTKIIFNFERKHYDGIALEANTFILFYIGRMKDCTMRDITEHFNFIASTYNQK